jgi:hypothetical protein
MDMKRFAATYPLADENTNHQDGDQEDNTEDDDDTGLTGSPVLLAIGQLVESVLAASHEGHVEGGHCECEVLLQC